jgi:hypothetical protein
MHRVDHLLDLDAVAGNGYAGGNMKLGQIVKAHQGKGSGPESAGASPGKGINLRHHLSHSNLPGCILLLLAVVSPSLPAHAQAGYQDVRWGDSLESIQKRHPTFTAESERVYIGALTLGYYYLHSLRLGVANQPVGDGVATIRLAPTYSYMKEDGSWTPESPEVKQTPMVSYYFVDRRFAAVSLDFTNVESVLPSLTQKYGARAASIGDEVRVIAWRSTDRLVVYEHHPSLVTELVWYVDPKVYDRAAGMVDQGRSRNKRAIEKALE